MLLHEILLDINMKGGSTSGPPKTKFGWSTIKLGRCGRVGDREFNALNAVENTTFISQIRCIENVCMASLNQILMESAVIYHQ